jgi:hypothetical protein
MIATDLMDLRKLAASLPNRRNKAAMVLHPQITEQRAYAANLAKAVGWPHLDLLKVFSDSPELTERLVVFSMSNFFDYLAQQKGTPGLVVSNIEFVLAAWLAQGTPRDVKIDLCKQVELWERAPAFLLVTSDEAVLANYQPSRHKGFPLILKTSQTLALE